MSAIENLSHQPLLLLLLVLAAFFVGLSKGGMPAIGMLSVPILSIFMAPLLAAVLLLPIYILSDLVGVYLYRHQYSRENVKLLIPTGIVGVLIGWATASVVSDAQVSFLIGVMGIVFCLYTWSKNRKRPPIPFNFRNGLFWGSLSGFTSFIAHAGGPPFQVFVLPQKLPKMIFAGTTTLVFAAINLAKVVPYSTLHPYNSTALKTAVFLIPVAGIGTMLGKKLIEKLPERWFYLAVQIALFIVSIKLVHSSLDKLF